MKMCDLQGFDGPVSNVTMVAAVGPVGWISDPWTNTGTLSVEGIRTTAQPEYPPVTNQGIKQEWPPPLLLHHTVSSGWIDLLKWTSTSKSLIWAAANPKT